MKNVMFVLMVVAAFAVFAGGEMVVSDFDDGTTQGWQLTEPAYSDIQIVTRGDGFALEAFDTTAAFGGPTLTAPSEFLGDLSGYDGISWDEYVYDISGVNYVRGSLMPILYGTDGTWYLPKDKPFGPLGVWNERYIPFDEAYWKEPLGSTGNITFDEVLSNVVEIWFAMECTSGDRREAKIDNIKLVPEPATMLMLGFGGLLMRKRK